MHDTRSLPSPEARVFDLLPARIATLLTFVALGVLALVLMLSPQVDAAQGMLPADDDAAMCRAGDAPFTDAFLD